MSVIPRKSCQLEVNHFIMSLDLVSLSAEPYFSSNRRIHSLCPLTPRGVTLVSKIWGCAIEIENVPAINQKKFLKSVLRKHSKNHTLKSGKAEKAHHKRTGRKLLGGGGCPTQSPLFTNTFVRLRAKFWPGLICENFSKVRGRSPRSPPPRTLMKLTNE